jgi:hypothetical protein
MAAPLITADALGMILFWLLARALESGSMVLGLFGFPSRMEAPFAPGQPKQGLQPVMGERTFRGVRSSNAWKTGSPAVSPDLSPGSKLGIAPQPRRLMGSWSQLLPSVWTHASAVTGAAA